MSRTELNVSEVLRVPAGVTPSQIYCKFGRAQVYFDWLDNDPVQILSGDLYFDDVDHYSINHVSLWPHVGVYGCGVPWMSMIDKNTQLSIYPDVMRGVVWYELALPRGLGIKSDNNKKGRLVGSVPLADDWRAWHYLHFFGVAGLKLGV